MSEPIFKPGDKVRHAERPEWGAGTVEQAVSIEHEGRPAQRLTIRFDHKGRTTLNTAYARLTVAESVGIPFKSPAPAAAPTPAASPAPGPAASPVTVRSPGDSGWLASIDASAPKTKDTLINLPQTCTDPLASLARRLKATLMLYRFTPDAKGIIEWAVAQTGLFDPLSEFSRHDLETWWKYFSHNREQHLKELVRQIKRAGQTELYRQLDPQTPQAGRNALAKAIQSA